jgi:hypothetical protein
MTQLPWDRFPTEPAPPTDELPYVPTPAPLPTVPAPAPPTVEPPPTQPIQAIDWGEVLDDAWPAIRDQMIDYARGSVKAIMAGETVDLTHPTVTATDMTGRELVVADAKSRSWRTLIQGLIFDVFAGIVAAVAILSGADPFQKQTWAAFGVLLLKSIVSAVISYFMRLKVTPTIKTEGEKFAVAPVPRPMTAEERKQSA